MQKIYNITLALLYCALLIGLAVFIYHDIVATLEGFAATSNTTPTAVCMACMDYFRDVLQFTDTNKVVPYVKQRSEYILFILSQFKDFVENNMDKCPKKGSVLDLSDVTACFPMMIDKYVTDCMKANNASRAECAIISTLGDKLQRKALECGAKACTIAEYRTRFVQALNAMVQDVQKCQAAFATNDSECTKIYAQVILSKTRPADPLDNSLQKTDDSSSSITKDDLRKSMGEATVFMMTNFA